MVALDILLQFIISGLFVYVVGASPLVVSPYRQSYALKCDFERSQLLIETLQPLNLCKRGCHELNDNFNLYNGEKVVAYSSTNIGLVRS